jgi:hypothetical protein
VVSIYTTGHSHFNRIPNFFRYIPNGAGNRSHDQRTLSRLKKRTIMIHVLDLLDVSVKHGSVGLHALACVYEV